MAEWKNQAKRISKRLVLSYVLDWIVLIMMAGISGGVAVATPHYRAFSPIDLSISYPYQDESITTVTLALVAGFVPAIIIVLLVLFFVPSPSHLRVAPRGAIIRAKLWEWNVGLLGLALTHATSQLLVQGMKNIAGKPRPDCLSRCQPDIANIEKYRVGGYGEELSLGAGWILVDQTACQQTDLAILEDGFRSFPSGHAAITTASFAGLLFLSLYVASKFSIWFPLLPYPGTSLGNQVNAREPSFYKSAAAAPLWLLLLIYVPIGVAIYITGILSAWLGFRWYHVPLGRSNGWSWGARSPNRAFAVGVGNYGWVTSEEEPKTNGQGLGTTNGQGRDAELGGVTGMDREA